MKYFLMIALLLIITIPSNSQNKFEKDIIKTSGGNLEITFVGHGTLMFKYNNLIIHIDPVSNFADFSEMPKADIILVTHQHGDHLDPKAIEKIKTDKTKIFCNEASSASLPGAKVLKNGDETTADGIKIEAVPAYNIVHKTSSGNYYHPKGVGNGYVLTFGDKKVYVAGDTENVPEMKNLKNIDIAFLPMNVPYTMTPEMVADAVKMFNPKILYPYHYGNTNVDDLVKLLKDKKDCEIRIRSMK